MTLIPTQRTNRLGTLGEQMATEIGLLREALADRAEAMPDLDRLDAAAVRFRSAVENSPNGGEESDVRTWRHDLRNRLNHLTGPAQFLAMAFNGDARPPSLDRFLALCEECLASTVEDEPEVSGHLAEHPISKPVLPGKLLVADDDAENRSLLGRLLEGDGHSVEFAENGRTAVEAIRNGDFDAVLLDIRMPEMDGFAVLEELRESGQLRHTPVIVVTGLQEEKDAVRCIEIGAEDFLSRPIRPAFLTARINASLEKKRLRETVFEQHFTPELAREFARNPDPMKMKGRNAEVTALFCDIRGFSAISERLGPEATVDWLGSVMGDFSSIVIDHGGVLVDYTGDELLALWGAPGDQPDHARRACRAAIDMIGRLPVLNETWRAVIGSETSVGIGISTGPALVGNIGTHRKFKYGPLGTTVNLGSRVQNATKTLRTPVLATGDTITSLDGAMFPNRRLGRVRVRNIIEPVDLHEIFDPGRVGWEELKGLYEEALSEFEATNFSQASSILGDLLVAFPGDGPALLLMSRVVGAMMAEGEATAFDPVWNLPGQ